MFCNNCGAQVPDGMNFCNSCGKPLTAQDTEHIPAQQNPAPPQKPEKKNSTPIIIAVIAVVVVVAVFCITAFVAPGFLINKEEKNDKDEKNSESTSLSDNVNAGAEANSDGGNEPVQNENKPSLNEAEDVAEALFENMLVLDFPAAADCEIVGWEFCEDVINAYFAQVAQEAGVGVDELYAAMSEGAGKTIDSVSDVIDLYADPDYVDEIYSAEYGSDYTDEFKVKNSEFITKEDAEKYIAEIKEEMDEFKNFGYDSSCVNWDKIEKFAKVESEEVFSGSVSSETLEGTLILGFIDGEWKVISIETDGETFLVSLALLEDLDF